MKKIHELFLSPNSPSISFIIHHQILKWSISKYQTISKLTMHTPPPHLHFQHHYLNKHHHYLSSGLLICFTMWSPYIPSSQSFPILDKVIFPKSIPNMSLFLVFTPSLLLDRELKLSSYFMSVFGKKSKSLTQGTKLCIAWSLFLFSVSFQNILHFIVCYFPVHLSMETLHVSSHCRTFVCTPHYVLNAFHKFLSLVKFFLPMTPLRYTLELVSLLNILRGLCSFS